MRFGPHSVALSHPEKVLFPDTGLTKQDLAQYYRAVADAMVPHLRGRPLTPQRFHAPELGPRRFTVADVPQRLADRGDPWKRTGRHARSLRRPQQLLDERLAAMPAAAG
jgi:bifunctional non-homologous end joining protein LigD